MDLELLEGAAGDGGQTLLSQNMNQKTEKTIIAKPLEPRGRRARSAGNESRLQLIKMGPIGGVYAITATNRK